jgi:hypothetical protein
MIKKMFHVEQVLLRQPHLFFEIVPRGTIIDLQKPSPTTFRPLFDISLKELIIIVF